MSQRVSAVNGSEASGCIGITWYTLWKSAERYFDRFNSASLTLMILKVGGYTALPWSAIWACIIIAFIGGILCGLIASLIAPEGENNAS